MVIFLGVLLRFNMFSTIFLFLCIAERTFQQVSVIYLHFVFHYNNYCCMGVFLVVIVSSILNSKYHRLNQVALILVISLPGTK